MGGALREREDRQVDRSSMSALAVDFREMFLEFGVAELINSPRLAQDLAVVRVL